MAVSYRNLFMVGAIVDSLLVFIWPHHCFWRVFKLCVGATLAGLSVSECVGAALTGFSVSEKLHFIKKSFLKKLFLYSNKNKDYQSTILPLKFDRYILLLDFYVSIFLTFLI